jgi:hypothetical protein
MAIVVESGGSGQRKPMLASSSILQLIPRLLCCCDQRSITLESVPLRRVGKSYADVQWLVGLVEVSDSRCYVRILQQRELKRRFSYVKNLHACLR